MADELKKTVLGYAAIKASFDLDKIKEESVKQAEEAKKLRILQEEMRESQQRAEKRLLREQELHNQQILEMQEEANELEQARWNEIEKRNQAKELQDMIDKVEPFGLNSHAAEVLIKFFNRHRMSTQRACENLKGVAIRNKLEPLFLNGRGERASEKYIDRISEEYKLVSGIVWSLFTDALFSSILDEGLDFNDHFHTSLRERKLKDESEKIELEAKYKEAERKRLEKEEELLRKKKEFREKFKLKIEESLDNYWIVKDKENLKKFKSVNGYKTLANGLSGFLSMLQFICIRLVACVVSAFCLWGLIYVEMDFAFKVMSVAILALVTLAICLVNYYTIGDLLDLKTMKNLFLWEIKSSGRDEYIKRILDNYTNLTVWELALFYGLKIDYLVNATEEMLTSDLEKLKEELGEPERLETIERLKKWKRELYG